MRKALKFFLAFTWQLPATLVIWTLYLRLFQILGYLRKAAYLSEYNVWVFEVTYPAWSASFNRIWNRLLMGMRLRKEFKEPLWKRLWAKWGGHACPYAVVTRFPEDERMVRHELRHVLKQWRYLGVFFPLTYWLLWMCLGYWDNPYEVDARAHETVEIQKWGRAATPGT